MRRRRHAGARTPVLLMTALCCAVALCGCGSDTATSTERDAGEFTVTADNVFVVDDHADLTLAGDEDSVLVFDMAGARPRIAPGDVVVGTAAGGYIRRVQRVAVDGARLFVTASPAFLAEAIVVGSVDTTVALGFRSSACRSLARGVSLSGDGLNLSGTTLYAGTVRGNDLAVTLTQGRIEFAPVVDLYASMKLGHLTTFRATAAGRILFTGDARIAADGPVDLSREVPLASVNETVVCRIGRVPVVLSITLTYVASLEIDLESAGTCELGIDAASPVRFGYHYEKHEWSCVAEASPEFTAHPFAYEASGPGSVRLAVAPRIDVAFYGVPGVSLSFGPDFGLIERNEGFPVLAWETFASMKSAMTACSGALDRRISPTDCERRLSRAILASGPFRTDDYIFVTQWGSEGSGPGRFGYPKGVAVDASGAVYVTDNWNNCVQKFTADGDFLLAWGTAGAGDGQFDSPERIAVDEDGFVYVADGGNDRVQKFTAEGVFVGVWGSGGEGDGEFRGPVGVAASEGVVYVVDSGNNRVQRFSTSGEFLGAWGGFGAGPGRFDGPAGVAAVFEGNGVYVADCRNNRVQRFSSQGELMMLWGSAGAGDGEFDCAVDVAEAIGDAVLVADLGNDRFQRFAPGGVFEAKLGTTGAGEGQLDHPEAIAVDRSGDVYVVDARNRRVQKFAPRVE